MAGILKQSSTAQPLVFFMTDSADHITGKTGLSPTVTLSKAGGAFASPSGAVSEIANGWYKVAGNATDTGTLGPLVLHATSAGADPSDSQFDVVAFDPQDAVRLGLTALPNAAANAAGGLVISAAGSLDMDDLAADVDAIETRVVLALPSAAPQAAGGLITSTAGSLDIDDMAADVDTTETRVTTALPNAAPQAAGGLITSTAGSLDLDEMNVDIEAIQVSTAGLTFTVANQVDANVLDWKSATAPAMTGDAFARLGAPAGASVSADILEANADLDELITTLGTPVASVSTDIASLNTLNVEMHGLLGKNSGVRNAAYSGSNLTSYDLCLYDSSAHATTNDGATGLLHQYSVVNTYNGSGGLLTSVTTRVS